MSPYNNFSYLQRRLNLHILTETHTTEVDLRRKFVYQYLKGDGTFMLRLVANNVSDYVCRKIIVELYKLFHKSLKFSIIGREPLFQPILSGKHDDDNEKDEDNKQSHSDIVDDDDNREITERITAADIPPLPNPRHGKIFFERESVPTVTSDSPNSEKTESQQADSISMTVNVINVQPRSRTTLIPLLKDTHRTSETEVGSSDITNPIYKNVDFNLEPNTTISSVLSSSSLPPLQRLPQSPTTKGPSPYATTYLTTKKRSEHELPYIDDSISSGSTSGRLTNSSVVQQTEKPTKKLASTNLFFRRSHDV